uniref:Uncharacterized protein n=1 Tax=Brassica oleracea var. oleracea TaxID=109376 RepID=A0A0D2ZS31_BRAOL
MIPSRRARASATSGDTTNSWVVDPCFFMLFCASEIIQASPALFDDLSHVASDLQIGV